jgi:hypothetical protein
MNREGIPLTALQGCERVQNGSKAQIMCMTTYLTGQEQLIKTRFKMFFRLEDLLTRYV